MHLVELDPLPPIDGQCYSALRCVGAVMPPGPQSTVMIELRPGSSSPAAALCWLQVVHKLMEV